MKTTKQGEIAEDYRKRFYRNYQDIVAKEFLAQGPIDPAVVLHPTFRAYYLPHVPADKEACLLDIGSGPGHLVSFLNKEGYRRAKGVDRSPQMVRLSRQAGCDIEEGDAIEYLRAHPAEFDVIFAMDVIEHLFKDELLELLDAVHGALKPGGCFLAHTVNADGFSWGRMRYIDITHETAFTRYSLGQVFQTVGFARYECFPIEPLVKDFRSLLRKIGWKMFRVVAGLYYHLEMGTGILRNDHLLTATLLAKAVKG